MGGAPTGYLLCGHGSRDAASVEGFAHIAAGLAPLLPDRPFAHGFMELASPTFDEAVGGLAAAGATRILAVPGFLLAARHVMEDLPRALAEAAAKHGVTFRLGRELGLDDRLTAALIARIIEAEGNRGAALRDRTALLLVGAGSSSPETNEKLAAHVDRLAASLGFGAGFAAFASVAGPTVPAAASAAAVRFRRVLLLPWFLTEGTLLGRARMAARTVVAPAELIEASVLGAHPLVLETLAARAVALAAADEEDRRLWLPL